MRFEEEGDRLCLYLGNRLIFEHSVDAPCFEIGHGQPDISMRTGNFQLEDRLVWHRKLTHWRCFDDAIELSFEEGGPTHLTLAIDGTALSIRASETEANRLWLRVVADSEEQVWGGGEQMSHLALRGRRFPLWTSEPGVGRDPQDDFTKAIIDAGLEGGDYWTTYYPQPTYLSSRRYALHFDSRAYACFDFTNDSFHEIEVWEIPQRIELFQGDDLIDLVGQLSTRFGRQPQLPDWAISGAIIGLKEGEVSFERLDNIIAAGADVTGLWCEDWAGVRQTTFGRRLFWDWQANDERYPNLAARIAEFEKRGIRFLAYVNPYLAIDGVLYQEARNLGLLVGRQDSDAPYLVDFGEFDCGLMDFTNPAAVDWYAERILGEELLDLGVAGWMADFGEYLPTDVKLFDGSDPLLMHNEWPVLWASVNARAIEQRGKTGEASFFMRAGHSGVGEHCPLLWAGDQSVDFSRHDGIGTAIRAALSAGLVGNAYHHSDLGGYTSLLANRRTPELLMRWAELAAFTPFMRSHEGNRPEDNLQIDSTAEILAHFARMTRVHARLAPYVRSLCEQAELTGLPLQRPLFLHYENDREACSVETQYFYGRDLLVAPVIEEDTRAWRCYLPGDESWVHLWSGGQFDGGDYVTVPAELGRPPVFYRPDSAHSGLFESFSKDPL